ncbi:MAG: septal ring lytic transglycosylase RlpA family protein [Acidobacteriota bacterium]|nr:septal ring lytic transglycosylase RlpA family protein [Acidobacteriota bacterium]
MRNVFRLRPPRLPALLFALALVLILLTGCGGKKRNSSARHIPTPPPTIATGSRPAPKPSPRSDDDQPHGKILYSETGIASWYGPPYHNRKAANGEIYDMQQPTAAHRTLPFGSLVRVTNVATGASTIVRINDRGPFITGRVIDLSLAAAKAIDVWRPGVALVRLDVLEAPADIRSGGRWCVQIGAFDDADTATELKQKLMRRYASAKVIQFSGPTGEWVRVRVPQDDKHQAEEVADATHTSAPVWLVRMD